MSRRERVQAAINRQPVDRVPDATAAPTAASALSLTKRLSPGRRPRALHAHHVLVECALDAITETLIKFAHLALTEGVSGIFYSIQAASRSAQSVEDYARF